MLKENRSSLQVMDALSHLQTHLEEGKQIILFFKVNNIYYIYWFLSDVSFLAYKVSRNECTNIPIDLTDSISNFANANLKESKKVLKTEFCTNIEIYLFDLIIKERL